MKVWRNGDGAAGPGWTVGKLSEEMPLRNFSIGRLKNGFCITAFNWFVIYLRESH